jgi:hypothetical protein
MPTLMKLNVYLPLQQVLVIDGEDGYLGYRGVEKIMMARQKKDD